MASRLHKNVINILEKNGFILDRQNGSHKFYKKDNMGVTVSTSLKSRHLANKIMQQAKLSYRF